MTSYLRFLIFKRGSTTEYPDKSLPMADGFTFKIIGSKLGSVRVLSRGFKVTKSEALN